MQKLHSADPADKLDAQEKKARYRNRLQQPPTSKVPLSCLGGASTKIVLEGWNYVPAMTCEGVSLARFPSKLVMDGGGLSLPPGVSSCYTSPSRWSNPLSTLHHHSKLLRSHRSNHLHSTSLLLQHLALACPKASSLHLLPVSVSVVRLASYVCLLVLATKLLAVVHACFANLGTSSRSNVSWPSRPLYDLSSSSETYRARCFSAV